MTTPELDGVINFRDFGGCAAADGRRVRRGRLYRSGHHAEATDEDLRRIADLDFALLVDLRRPPERARDIARRPSPSRARLIEHGGPADMAVAPHLTFLAEPDATPERVKAQMTIGYRGYPFDPFYLAVYRDYFAALAEIDGPVLINCHAGKDRTGFLCALTLHVLGAPREAIVEDYLATNRHNRADLRIAEMSARFEAEHGHPVSPALISAMLAADVDWLNAAFDAVESAHGATDAYLADHIGVSPTRRDAIRARLLE